jgi:hypothetical protein
VGKMAITFIFFYLLNRKTINSRGSKHVYKINSESPSKTPGTYIGFMFWLHVTQTQTLVAVWQLRTECKYTTYSPGRIRVKIFKIIPEGLGNRLDI